SGSGTVARKSFVLARPAAIIVPSSARKNSSRPSPRHRGACPPSRETGYTLSLSGNGRTYTSLRPELSDSYAIQRPSGEMAPLLSLNGVFRNGTGVRAPDNGSIHRSRLVSGR